MLRTQIPLPARGWRTATHLAFVLTVTLVALLVSNPILLLALLAVVVGAAGRHRLLRDLLGPGKWLIYGAFGIILFNLVLAPGTTKVILGSLTLAGWHLEVGFALEALWFGLAMALRLMVVSLAFLYLFHLMPPARLLSLGSGMLPRFRLTVMMAASTYPRLRERAEEVDEAFISRGGASGSRLRRWRRATRRLLPLLEDSLEASIDAAGFLELRGRSRRDTGVTFMPDLLPGLGFLLLLTLAVGLLVSGIGVYDPLLGAPDWPGALIASPLLVLGFAPYLVWREA